MGKHITVNQMVAKESVRARIESDTGISFTEFSYMLLQANDFRWLYEHERVRAADGRLGPVGQHHRRHRPHPARARRHRARPHLAAADPKADGAKFGQVGRAERCGSTPSRTSPYQFRQFLVQADDADVERQLLLRSPCCPSRRSRR